MYRRSIRGVGEVVLLGDFNSRIGKASKLNENVGQYGEETKNMNGEEISLKHNEMKTLHRNGLDSAYKKENLYP